MLIVGVWKFGAEIITSESKLLGGTFCFPVTFLFPRCNSKVMITLTCFICCVFVNIKTALY